MGLKVREVTLVERMSEARVKGAELAHCSDALNDRIGRVEAQIIGLQLGVAGLVKLPLAAQIGDTELSFRKAGDSWGLFIDFPNGKAIPLQSASRLLRLEAVRVLKELIEELIRIVDAQVREVSTGVKTLDGLLEELGDIPF